MKDSPVLDDRHLQSAKDGGRSVVGVALEVGTEDEQLVAVQGPGSKLIRSDEATDARDGATVRVFVELRAPNYPGSTYTLTYDSKRDELYGVYYQAVEGRNFDVVFARMK